MNLTIVSQQKQIVRGCHCVFKEPSRIYPKSLHDLDSGMFCRRPGPYLEELSIKRAIFKVLYSCLMEYI